MGKHRHLGSMGPRNPQTLVSTGYSHVPRSARARTLDLLRVAIDADHVLSGPHVQREALAEALRGLQQEAVAVRDGAPDVVGQAAVRERDVVVTLEYDDLR